MRRIRGVQSRTHRPSKITADRSQDWARKAKLIMPEAAPLYPGQRSLPSRRRPCTNPHTGQTPCTSLARGRASGYIIFDSNCSAASTSSFVLGEGMSVTAVLQGNAQIVDNTRASCTGNETAFPARSPNKRSLTASSSSKSDAGHPWNNRASRPNISLCVGKFTPMV